MKLSASVTEVDWEAVYTEQLPRVYNFFRYWVEDRALAEDLTAATFEKAWRARDHYRRNLGQFSTWLFTIARHVMTNHFQRTRTEMSIDDVQQPIGGETPEETVQRRNDFRRLSTLLAQLPARERELVALKYGAELTNREIAKLAALSESNVGTILHRVVLRLRAAWEVDA